MIVPDLNVILHAYNKSSGLHLPARTWWEAALSGDEPVGFAWVTLLGFLRIATRAQAMDNPISVRAATKTITSWLQSGNARILHPGERHMEILFEFLHDAGVAGNLTTDAHLAAIAREHRARIATTDSDFARFAGVAWFNPLATGRGAGPRPASF